MRDHFLSVDSLVFHFSSHLYCLTLEWISLWLLIVLCVCVCVCVGGAEMQQADRLCYKGQKCNVQCIHVIWKAVEDICSVRPPIMILKLIQLLAHNYVRSLPTDALFITVQWGGNKKCWELKWNAYRKKCMLYFIVLGLWDLLIPKVFPISQFNVSFGSTSVSATYYSVLKIVNKVSNCIVLCLFRYT